MLRYLISLLALTSTLATGPSLAQESVIPVVPGASRIVIPLANGVFVRGPSSLVFLMTATEAEFDSVAVDEPGGISIMLERAMLVQKLRDSLRTDLSVLTIVGKNHPRSQRSYGILTSDDIGIERAGGQISALTMASNLILHPGDIDLAFIVFRRMTFYDSDSLYIQFTSQR